MLNAAAPPDPSTISLIVTVVLAIAGTSAAGIIAKSLFDRRKTSAEARKTDADGNGAQATAAAVLTGSALTLLGPMREEIKRLGVQQLADVTRIVKLERTVEESQQRERGHVRQLTAYRKWIDTASKLLAERGIPIDPPPHDEGTSFPPPLQN